MDPITLLYFAGARDALGRQQDRVPLHALTPRPDLDALWRWLIQAHPAASTWRDAGVRVAVNQSFVRDPHYQLEPGDEVAIIPPVSGGGGAISDGTGRFVLTEHPLDVRQVEALVRREAAGALVTFQGVVRDHTGDRQVAYLDYEAYEAMALREIVRTAHEASSRWPTTLSAVHHRHGRLVVGERAVVIAVSSPHRAEAFAACQFLIDRLKEIAPIWKREVGEDGAEWVGWGP